MKLFGSDAPGVEWTPEKESEATVPVVAPVDRAAIVDPYPPHCPSCGADLGIDGYCQVCGAKAKTLREHYEMNPAPWVSGVCDIGRLHARNEDALDVKANETIAIIVVCDGVTTSLDSDRASMAAARTAAEFLWFSTPAGIGTPESRSAAVRSALVQAVTRSNDAVVASTDPYSPNAAASTIAIGMVDGSHLYAANLGDSRIYWLPDEGEPIQLSRDHSLAQTSIDSGANRAEAEASAIGHTITKWLGLDATDIAPYVADQGVTDPGWFIVCSDGLWNYTSEAGSLERLVRDCGASTPTALATWLTQWANDQGGHDNVTVACARVPAPSSTPAPPPPDDSAPQPESEAVTTPLPSPTASGTEPAPTPDIPDSAVPSPDAAVSLADTE